MARLGALAGRRLGRQRCASSISTLPLLVDKGWVLVPQVALARQGWKRPAWVAAGLVVAVLAVAGYGWWRLVPSAAAVVSRADELNLAGRYGEAQAALKPALGRAVTKGDKALVLSRLGGTTYSLGDKAGALKYYQDLDRLQPHSYATLTSIGDIAMELGQKGVAAEAYEQAVGILKAGQKHETTDSEIDRLDGLVTELRK